MAERTATFGLYWRLVAARIRADFQYRTSFFLFLAAQVLVVGTEFATIAVIFGRVDTLAGWSVTEVALLFGISSLAFAIADLFLSQVETASVHIKAGTFDKFLIRPVGTLTQLSAMEFAPRRLGRSVQPVIVLAIAVPRLPVAWTPAHLLLLPVTLVSGATIYGAIWVMSSSLSFWTVETQELASSFTYGGNFLSSYPVDLFGAALRRLVVFVVPVAFVAYVPCAVLLDKPLVFGLPRASAWLTPAVAAASALAARAVWHRAVRHYRSTGS